MNDDENGKEVNLGLDEILNSTSNSNKVKKVGTVNPVEDFKVLADRILSSCSKELTTLDAQEDFEDLCLQIQILIKDLFNESLEQLSSSISGSSTQADDLTGDLTICSFQEKAFKCIKIQREYTLKFNSYQLFNSFLKTFKSYLINEYRKNKFQKQIEDFWRKHFLDLNSSLITKIECESSDITVENAQEFLDNFVEAKEETNEAIKDDLRDKENVEDLLDLM